MKITKFSKQNFQDLNQLDKIEFLLRKDTVIKNIRKSLPIFEIVLIFIVLAYSRLHTLLLLNAFDFSETSIQLVNIFSTFFNTIIVILVISFIARIMIYFKKHQQLSELHEEFLDRIKYKESEIKFPFKKKNYKK